MSTLVSDTPQKHYQENGDENEVNFMLTPDMRPEIKNEPPEDIDDTPQFHMLATPGSQQAEDRKPNITLTPTMKLLASPNPIDPKRKFSCPYENCTKSYGKSSHLRSHLTWHTGVKPYVCQEANCGKSFTRSDELNRHSRTHTGEKPFECMQCGKKFSRSDHLTKHVATHTKQMQSQKRVRGPERSMNVEPKSEIDDEANDDSSEAKRMGINYTDGMHFMASLLECTQFKHGRHVIEPENLTGEHLDSDRLPIRIKLERPEHSDEYKIVNTAADHVELEQKVKIKTEGETPEEITNVPAEIATSTAPIVYNAATAHENENNGCNADDDMDDDDNTNDDTIMPEANAAPMSQAGSFLVAPNHNHSERPYGCMQCMKSFKRQDDLNRHLRTHTGEKPYACTQCEKRFMRSDHLKKHLKTHFKQL